MAKKASKSLRSKRGFASATRRRVLQGAAAGAAAGAVAGVFPASFTRALAKDDKPAKKPNILFIFVDQHRPDAYGAAGNPYITTPNLDRIAREGTRFSTMWDCPKGPRLRRARRACDLPWAV